jgi:hypothetical protein
LGANIDKDAYLMSSVLVLEADMLTVGCGTIIKEEVTLFGHKFQSGKLELSTVSIGKECEIGALSVVLPGSNIGNSVMVRPLTQVMPDERLSDQCMYGGSPMEWLGTWDLERTGGTSLVMLPGSEDMGSLNTARRKSTFFNSRRTITTSETDVEALVPVEELRVSESGR